MTLPAPSTIPDYVDVFPQLAQAALRSGQESLVACWALLRACDPTGSGYLDRANARRILEDGRRVRPRQARRLIHDGVGPYWTIDKKDRLWLGRVDQVADGLGVEAVSRPHQIPIADLQGGRTRLRAAFEATVYRTDEGGTPLSRRLIRELTGIPESTQRRYESHGHAKTVAQVHTKITHITTNPAKAAIAAEYRGAGFYRGSQGDLMRRHADRRQAAHHLPGSSAKARRVNQRLTKPVRRERPVTKAHGEHSRRAFFPASPRGRSGHKAWVKTPNALGKPGHESEIEDAIFDYAVVETRGKNGRSCFESVTLPDLPERGHPLSGSLKACELDQTPSPSPPHATHFRSNDDRDDI